MPPTASWPCGQIGRFVQTSISFTRPTMPASTHSFRRRMPSPVWPWLPMLVFTPFLRAASSNWSASHNRLTNGFCTITCLRRLIASIAAGKWVWSGVATITQSTLSPIASSISRKLPKPLASGYLASVPARRSRSTSQHATIRAASDMLPISEAACPPAPTLANWMRFGFVACPSNRFGADNAPATKEPWRRKRRREREEDVMAGN